jgi:hypothetical protein
MIMIILLQHLSNLYDFSKIKKFNKCATASLRLVLCVKEARREEEEVQIYRARWDVGVQFL